jgi:hypothetical protein
MSKYKTVLQNLVEISTFPEVKIRAADVAADVPLTCRCHTADVAADFAADVRIPEQPESLFLSIIHSVAWRQIIVA